MASCQASYLRERKRIKEKRGSKPFSSNDGEKLAVPHAKPARERVCGGVFGSWEGKVNQNKPLVVGPKDAREMETHLVKRRKKETIGKTGTTVAVFSIGLLMGKCWGGESSSSG